MIKILKNSGESLYNSFMPSNTANGKIRKIEMAKSSRVLVAQSATAKAVNYTPEQTEKMVADYQAGVAVDVIAVSLGKTVRSVVAKLSREKVYKAKEYATKTGEKSVKKDAHADAIGAILKMTESEIESLTKANKTALVKIFTALANSKPL